MTTEGQPENKEALIKKLVESADKVNYETDIKTLEKLMEELHLTILKPIFSEKEKKTLGATYGKLLEITMELHKMGLINIKIK